MFVLVSSAIFLAAVPFARIPLAQVPAFVPMYVTALVICDVITAVLLLGQFMFLQSRALLILACGYVFTAAMTFSYVLMFPGLFSPAGLLGAGPQSTSAMYIFWHAGFPLLVIGYALFKGDGIAPAVRNAAPTGRAGIVALLSIAAVIAVVGAYTVFVTAGRDYLPMFLDNNKTSDLGHIVLSGDWVLSFIALGVLWWRRPHTVIDVWLMVVMCVWLFDLALAAILNTGRYDLGWYFGRIYGLLAASSLLVILLIENGNHYAGLLRMSVRLGEANSTLEQLSLHDSLTSLPNRRFFDAYIANQIALAQRHSRTLALVLYDVDAFKAYNDLYGHQAGDECLKQVADALRSCCRRPADFAARYGGEEFAMILPETELSGATLIAESAREAVTLLRIAHGMSPTAAHLTLSGGVAVLVGEMKAMTVDQLVAAADRALFQAKERGRNRIVSVQEQPLAISWPTSAAEDEGMVRRNGDPLPAA